MFHSPYPGCIILYSVPQFHEAGVQGGVFLLQNFYTNVICPELLLHIQKHVSRSLKIYNEQHINTYNMTTVHRKRGGWEINGWIRGHTFLLPSNACGSVCIAKKLADTLWECSTECFFF